MPRLVSFAVRRAVRVLLAGVAFVGLLPQRAAAHGGDVLVRMAPVEASGLPRSYVTITLAIPEPLRDAESVFFEVRLTGLTDVVGRVEGVLNPRENKRVVLTLRVPADALAGILDVADVVFYSRNGAEYVIPILLRVPAVRGFTVTGTREFRGLRTGDRVDLLYAVLNHGNAPDTLLYTVATPSGWIVRPEASARRVVVPARGRVELPAAVTVPAFANVGDHSIEVLVRGVHDSTPPQRVSTTLGVQADDLENTQGVTVRPLLAFASAAGQSVSFLSATIEGPVARDVNFTARFAPDRAQGGAAAQGLSSVGASSMPFSATVYGEEWRAYGGNVGIVGQDLTGANLVGRGISAESRLGGNTSELFLARPSASQGSGGVLVAGSHAWPTRFGRFGASVAHLEDGAEGARSLNAIGVEYRPEPFGTIRARGSLAYRASNAAHGIGVGVSVEHERDGERASLRFAHAPGGTMAYARATDEFQLMGSKRLSSRLAVDGSVLTSRDNGSLFTQMSNTSWSVGQRFTIAPTTAFWSRVQSSSFDARTTSTVGGFGSDELGATAGLDWRWGEFALGAELNGGVATRRSDLLDGRVSSTSSPQGGARADVSREHPRLGSFSGGLGVQMSGQGVGVPSRVITTDAQWTGAPILVFSRPTRLHASTSLQRFGAQPALVNARVGLRMALPSGFDVVMNVERNPFFGRLPGQSGLIAAMSVTTSTRVFSATVWGPEGVVYEDRNRNGAQDAGEPGVRGVTIRRGSARAVTDRDGRYRLPASARGRTQVDIATIPAGLVAHPSLGAEELELRDIPLLTTGSVSIDMEIVADADGRKPDVDLRPAVILLRDSTGFEWVGRRTGPKTVTFEGIPTGTYTLRAELSGLREQLRPEDDAIVVNVQPHERRRVILNLRGRAVRFIAPPPRANLSGRGGAR